jgi:dihydrofolate synthase / folylpolyglutamate synthase
MTDDWVDYLDSLAAFGMKPGLERVDLLLETLGHPQRAFRSVHIVGTNGKSSTARYAAAVMAAHGLRSAAYLSPHLTGYPERVLIGGRPVATAAFARAVTDVRAAVAGLTAAVGETTQFEVLTVAAFLAMAQAGVEVAAVEAGLGGRLDATNVLRAPVVALTNIGLEHTDVLGATRELIFAEKAAVIAAGADAVFGDLDRLEPLAAARCAEVGARAHYVGRDVLVEGGPEELTVRVAGGGARTPADGDAATAEYAGLRLPTRAGYQAANAALAVAACHYLLGGLRAEAVRDGLAGTAVPGRLQLLRRRPLVIADGAHNAHGVAAMATSIAAIERPRPRVVLLAVLADKAVDEMLRIVLPLADAVVCTRAGEPRSLSAEQLAARVRGAGFAGPLVADDEAHAAYGTALRSAGSGGSVLVTGSLYLLEELADELASAVDE